MHISNNTDMKNTISMVFTEIDEAMNWSLDKPTIEKTVSYIITVKRESGSTEIAGSAKLGEELDLSELCEA